MKKINKFLFLFALIPTLSACQDVKHSIYSVKVASEFMIDLTVTQLLNLLENKGTFMLEVYSPTCGHCIDMKEKLDKYVNEYQDLIYRFNLERVPTLEDFNALLHEPYGDIFPDSYVPTLQFVKEGKLTYSVSPNKFSSYTGVKTQLNKHFIKTNIKMVNNYNDYQTYKNEQNEYMIAGYDLSDADSVKLINRCIFNNSSLNKKLNILLINNSDFSESELTLIKQDLNVEYDTFTAIYQDETYKNAFNYVLDEGASIMNNLVI